ncbi:MAG: leucine--tRNA ligase [Halobacteriales archaeon]
MAYDPSRVEAKWRERWAQEGWYEVDPEGDPDDVTFVTVAYPYPNGAMHVGHVRTYTVPDVYARYRRMRGDTVLFPMAWHVTGTPIIGAVERLQKREPEQVRILRDVFEVPEEDFPELETPMGFARYFIENSYKHSMRLLGLSIDWRREFTTNDEPYREFISWQYETLRDHDRLTEDTHPVNYCTNEQQPVTTHDLLEGEDAEFQEYTLVKFGLDDAVVPMATLRPETVRGVTNAYVHPTGRYVRAIVDGQAWIVSEDAAEKLDLQQREVEVESTVAAEALIGAEVENPVTGDAIPILPATFVDVDNATGVVMSVPAHSPDDWVALQALKADPSPLEAAGLDPAILEEIQPVQIAEVEGYGEQPAAEVVEAWGIEDQDDPALEEATQELYNREFHQGRLTPAYGEFAGERIEDVRDAFRERYVEAGAFDTMYEFNEEVVCRCGGDVEVAVQDTWFLKYNDPDWRRATREALDGAEILPESSRDQYEHTIGWLEEWPCIRNYGLGTPLPWDEEFIIEPLSDSTIYMAFYTLAHRLDGVDGPVDRELFREVFQAEDPSPAAAALREEFEYWYPVDVRFSASELIPNHLTFYLYHHADLFEPPKWPAGITTMGMGLVKGKSMSSSAGRVVLADQTVEEYGADTVRFFLMNSAEPWQDFDWRPDPVGNTRDQLDRFWRRAVDLIEGPEGDRELEPIDRWLLGRLQRTVETTTAALEAYETRTASQAAFFEIEEDLRWYRRRADLDRPGARWTLREVLRTRLRLLAPFVPFMANELHERLTGEAAEGADWPAADETLVREDLEVGEALVRDLVDDIQNIVDVTETEPGRIRIYAAADWKREVLGAVLEAEATEAGEIVGELMADARFRERGGAVPDLVERLVESVHARPRALIGALPGVDEVSVLERAAGFLAEEFDADIEVYREDEGPPDPAGRADAAIPGRPAIHVEPAGGD